MTAPILLVGNLTIDHNCINGRKTIAPGGSVFYSSYAFQNLGFHTDIVSPYGEDFPKDVLFNSSIYPVKPLFKNNLIFKNIYIKSNRVQEVGYIGSASYAKIKATPLKLLSDKKIIMICPVINNISYEMIYNIKCKNPNALFVLLAQGFFRKVNGNKIVKTEWKNYEKILKLFDISVISSEDSENSDYNARIWSILKPISVVTKNMHGCTIYKNGIKTDYDAFKADKVADTTGAGDIFAASFVYAYVKTGNLSKPAVFANASACFSLRFPRDSLKYTHQDVENFAKFQGRDITL